MTNNPTPSEIREARAALGLTQQQAGELVGASARTWRSWEDDGGSGRVMPAAKWELFQIKTNGCAR